MLPLRKSANIAVGRGAENVAVETIGKYCRWDDRRMLPLRRVEKVSFPPIVGWEARKIIPLKRGVKGFFKTIVVSEDDTVDVGSTHVLARVRGVRRSDQVRRERCISMILGECC